MRGGLGRGGRFVFRASRYSRESKSPPLPRWRWSRDTHPSPAARCPLEGGVPVGHLASQLCQLRGRRLELLSPCNAGWLGTQVRGSPPRSWPLVSIYMEHKYLAARLVSAKRNSSSCLRPRLPVTSEVGVVSVWPFASASDLCLRDLLKSDVLHLTSARPGGALVHSYVYS